MDASSAGLRGVESVHGANLQSNPAIAFPKITVWLCIWQGSGDVPKGKPTTPLSQAVSNGGLDDASAQTNTPHRHTPFNGSCTTSPPT
jgi:hypothetical protein